MALRILLITPQFYGIEKTIKSVLEDSGYEVVWFENKTLPLDYHGTNSKFKLIRKIYYFLFSPAHSYLKREMCKTSDNKFDILFSINAHIICPYLFRILKNKNPDLFSVLYLWDSFSMYDWSNELKLFKKVYTFDPEDSAKYKITYKPNFFVKSEKSINLEFENDLIFIGKFSSDRLMILDKLLKQLDESSLNYYIKLWPAYKIFPHSHLFYRFLKLFNLKNKWVNNYLLNFEAFEKIITRKYFLDLSLDHNNLKRYFSGANVTLDLPNLYQKGYAHRVIEALAHGKKVITTNACIKNESFYNPEQIQIIDYQKPEMDIAWIRQKSSFSVDKYFSDLELSVWIKSLINVELV